MTLLKMCKLVNPNALGKRSRRILILEVNKELFVMEEVDTLGLKTKKNPLPFPPGISSSGKNSGWGRVWGSKRER